MGLKVGAQIGDQVAAQVSAQLGLEGGSEVVSPQRQSAGADGIQAPIRRVLDTNIVLDLWVFDEPRAEALRTSVESGSTQWLATATMREELARVLAYPQIVKRLAHRQLPASAVLAHFDRWAQLQPDAPKAPYVCKDADDQMFIDLAVQHTATLHSKDAQVLCMKKRLERCGVALNPAMPSAKSAPL
ncbi:MAG: VapC toxin family PIN domain ribonuclease [Comamonadaceae bacterium PBBC1]|nr:MAG: VapC toxin family PIN domain ribonuclease [Comamonadaceae bacterium PBBC1]